MLVKYFATLCNRMLSYKESSGELRQLSLCMEIREGISKTVTVREPAAAPMCIHQAFIRPTMHNSYSHAVAPFSVIVIPIDAVLIARTTFTINTLCRVFGKVRCFLFFCYKANMLDPTGNLLRSVSAQLSV